MNFSISNNNSNCLKFISAILIVLHHYSQQICESWPLEKVKDITYYLCFPFHLEAGYVGVAVFFFLSGYGLMESEHRNHLTIKPFLKKRFSKVYLPVLLVSIIWLPIYYLFIHQGEIVWYEFLFDIFWGFQDGAMWFINVLLFLYLSFAIYAKLIGVKERGANIVFILLIALITLATRYLKGSFAMIGIPMFLIGVYVSNSKYHQQSIVKKVILPMTTSLSMIDAYLFVAFGQEKLALVICAAFAYSVVFILIVYFSNNKIDFIFPPFLGVVSFDIYLVHNKVLTLLCNNGSNSPLYLYLIVVIFATVLFYVIRKNVITRRIEY